MAKMTIEIPDAEMPLARKVFGDDVKAGVVSHLKEHVLNYQKNEAVTEAMRQANSLTIMTIL